MNNQEQLLNLKEVSALLKINNPEILSKVLTEKNLYDNTPIAQAISDNNKEILLKFLT